MRKLSSMADVITDPYKAAVARNDFYYPWGVNHNQEELEYAKRVSEDPSVSPYFLRPDGTYAYFGQTDWFGEAYKNLAFSTNHNVDVSGKTERLNYYFSAGYNYQDGMVSQGTDKFNRYNLRSKLDFKLTDWWSLGNNTSLVVSDYDAPYFWGMIIIGLSIVVARWCLYIIRMVLIRKMGLPFSGVLPRVDARKRIKPLCQPNSRQRLILSRMFYS